MSKFTRLRLSEESTRNFKLLKTKTGLTPNILSRIAFCYSINDETPVNPAEYDSEGQELNRYTLLGEYDQIYSSLLKEKLITEGLDPNKDFYDHLRAHINRGSFSLYNRVKSLSDLYSLLPPDLVKKKWKNQYI